MVTKTINARNYYFNNCDLNPSNSLANEVKKTFNITPAVQRKFGSANESLCQRINRK